MSRAHGACAGKIEEDDDCLRAIVGACVAQLTGGPVRSARQAEWRACVCRLANGWRAARAGG
ncbi:hypothetical protein E2562_034890 [Oryza meyeriana var. granulata]|uniref:Uncharacterized protein n=1 Tax=Oryza meyeriana var. granulata TaxID=110450 RepID=A0A6G1C139_9ORYZ|nr:hypothetical protein E2562_034890 [Oryza meyeriana var. granulata]